MDHLFLEHWDSDGGLNPWRIRRRLAEDSGEAFLGWVDGWTDGWMSYFINSCTC